MKLDKNAGDDPARLDARPPAALGARPEVRRAHARQVDEDASRTARRCRPSRSRYPGRARRLLPHLRRARRATARRRRTSRASATRFALARRVAQRDDRRRCRASSSHLEPVARIARRRPTRSSARFFDELGDAARDRRAGRRPLRALVRGRRRHVRGVVALPRPRSARRSATVAPDAATPASSSLPRPAAVPAPTLPRFSRALRARDRRSCRARCRGSPARCETGIPVLRALARGQRRARARRSTRSTTLDERPGARSTRCAALTRLVGHPPPADALRRARTSRSATTSTTPGRTSASTSPSPTRPAARSARCSTRRRARVNPTRPVASARSAPRRPSNGEPVVSGAPMNLHSNVYSAGDRPPTGNADCESGQRGYMQKLTHLRRGPEARRSSSTRTSRATRARRSPAARACPRARRSPACPRAGPRCPKELDK